VAAYDWEVLARRILTVYETVVPPGGGGVTAGDDDDEFPAVPPARMQARSSRRGRVQR
jgi:phosphatidylinositol alpha-mannosyltransferase